MKLIYFKASNVHGYLDFNINFNDDLNFLTGLNGTGKTTALNLIIALITPSFKHLIKTNFKDLELLIIHNKQKYKLVCKKMDKKLYLKINNEESYLNLHGLPIEDESEESIRYELHNSSVIDLIGTIPTPMFLDLDRKFIQDAREIHYKKKRYNKKQYLIDEDFGWGNQTKDLSLNEVVKQIDSMMSSINRGKLRLAEKLKKKILKDSFALQKLENVGTIQTPTITELHNYKDAILSTLNQLDLLEKEDEQSLDTFFISIEKIINNLNNISKDTKISHESNELSYISEWIVNQPQLTRIIKLSEQINEHQQQVQALEKTKEKFLNSINLFYEQTNKKLIIKANGKTEILINGHVKTIELLSSGERQLLIILSHLNLNRNLPKSAVFIIDEPELSLHLLWQEMFVDEIIKAQPNLQIILATHAPAIVNNKKHKHVPLNNE